ncbi:type II secretion system protein GspL [Pseudomonas sp. NPDC090755]|uniref:type II secretion system protein GspL n=1 Tax=Pseudomonas sp. NPDC090755 TaxID=3364481 RepID=UPI00383AC53C
MQAWLYLTTPAGTNDRPLIWWQSNGEVSQGDLEQAAADLKGVELTLLLPAEIASHHNIEVPARSGRWLRQAIRSALEEKLLDDFDDLLLAQGPLRERRYCRLFVLKRDWLHQVLASLAQCNLQPRRIHIDADCLPGDRALALRCGGRWLIGGATPQRLALLDNEVEDLKGQLPPHLQWSEAIPWPLLAAGSHQAIDVCQGVLARRDNSHRLWPALALLVAVGVGAQLVQDVSHRLLLDQRTEALAQSNLASWQKRYPEQSRVVDLARQVRARRQQLGETRLGVAHGLDRLARLWRSSGGAIAQVDRLDYLAGEGWTLRIQAPTFADIERLREGLVSQGLSVLSDSSVRDAKGVSARLQIKE